MGKITVSIKNNIKDEMQNGKVYAPKDFTKIVGSRVASEMLRRLVGDGEVEKVSYGKYQLKNQQASESKLSVLEQVNGILMARNQVFNRIGMNYGGQRDTWEALGYNRSLTFQDYLQWYERGDIAKRLIEAPAKACWKNAPSVVDDEGEDGEFAKIWEVLNQENQIDQALSKADIKSRIGRFGIMLLGFPGDFKTEVKPKSKLLYITSFMENAVKDSDIEFEDDPKNPRFGKPKFYTLEISTGKNSNKVKDSLGIRVHHSRILYLAEDRIADNFYGAPAMQAVFNKLQDLEKVIGGSAESVWKTFDRGMAFNIDSDTSLSESEIAKFDQEVQNYMHGMQRFIRTQGMDVKSLGAEAADPRGHFQVLASIISGTTGIPQRILFGSERGQLASTADQNNWNDRIRERQQTYLEPDVLLPLVNQFIALGLLPEPSGVVRILWPDLDVPTEREKLEDAKTISQAMRNLISVVEMKVMTISEARDFVGLPKLEENETDFLEEKEEEDNSS